MELFKGRPKDETGRLEKEIKVYDFLDELGIEYERTDHEPADTMEACNKIDAVLGTLICKNLFSLQQAKNRFLPFDNARQQAFLKQKTLRLRSVALAFRLHHPNIWKSSLIFHPVRFQLWGL